MPKQVKEYFDVFTKELTVYSGMDAESGIYFQGLPEDYDGNATDPSADLKYYINELGHLTEEEYAEYIKK